MNETVKVVKVVKVKVFQVFQNIPGSQLLSDIQTFLAGNQLHELKTHGWLLWLSKKTIAIFGYKQRLLSLDMKTKLVQHVESD